jgi:hypothetical protein
MQEMKTALYLAVDDIGALYENSEQFTKYLKRERLDVVLSYTNLKLREAHTIVPHVRILLI